MSRFYNSKNHTVLMINKSFPFSSLTSEKKFFLIQIESFVDDIYKANDEICITKGTKHYLNDVMNMYSPFLARFLNAASNKVFTTWNCFVKGEHTSLTMFVIIILLDKVDTSEIQLKVTLTLSQTSPGFYVSAVQVF